MLILTRMRGEKIIIGPVDGQMIEVTVTYIDRGKVRLGVEADPRIPVFRKELLDKDNAGSK